MIGKRIGIALIVILSLAGAGCASHRAATEGGQNVTDAREEKHEPSSRMRHLGHAHGTKCTACEQLGR
ncbi:MAG TPA: hypothetical protein PK869_14160 [Candidatus Hydrogenedentes bacterium]|nr:hypothetical protein [Candidatus Hydrogenedentota bacterium]